MLATMLKASSYGNDSDVGSSMDIIMMLERDSIFNVRVTQVCFDEVMSAEAPPHSQQLIQEEWTVSYLSILLMGTLNYAYNWTELQP